MLVNLPIVLLVDAAVAQTASDVLQRTRTAYHNLHTYSDTGDVATEYQGVGTNVLTNTKGSFQTSYEAPRHFRLKFKKENGEQLAIWTIGQERTVYSWWSVTLAQDSNPTVVPFLTAAHPTMGTTTLIPALLFPQASFNGQFDQLTDPKLETNEHIDGHTCYKITGNEAAIKGTMVRPLTLWIDTESLLVRRVVEGTPQSMGKGGVSRTTWNIRPQADPMLKEEDFVFSAAQ
jgi:hypothetical protein